MKEKNKRTKEKKEIFLVCLMLSIIFLSSTIVMATPTGPDTADVVNTTKKETQDATMINISGGVIAKINITASVQNENWKAFVGNVSGSFTLQDSSGNSIYDWTGINVSGNVLTSRSDSVDWTTISCATTTQITTEETSMGHDGGDNISSTFNSMNTGTYVVNSLVVSPGNCYATETKSDTGTSTAYEEILIYDTTGSNMIYSTEVNEGIGFDGSTYDFQMIVPENATAGAAQTEYYLYVELTTS